jgi:hypothetical protein
MCRFSVFAADLPNLSATRRTGTRIEHAEVNNFVEVVKDGVGTAEDRNSGEIDDREALGPNGIQKATIGAKEVSPDWTLLTPDQSGSQLQTICCSQIMNIKHFPRQVSHMISGQDLLSSTQ